MGSIAATARSATATARTASASTNVLVAAVLFGTTGTAQALAPHVEPLVVGAARIEVGAVLLGVIALAGSGRRPAGASRLGGRPMLVLLAGVCVAVYQTTFFAALTKTGVAVGTVVAIGSGPAFAGVFARLFGGEPLERRWAAATALACFGVALLVLGGSGAGTIEPSGVGLALVSGAGYAGYTVATKRMLAAGGEPEPVIAAVFGTGAVLLLPVFALFPMHALLSPGGIALAVYLGAVPTALAYVLFARGLERIGAGETTTLTLAEPLTAATLGVVVLGEQPGLVAAAGAALVVAGLGLLATKPRPRLRAQEAPAHA